MRRLFVLVLALAVSSGAVQARWMHTHTHDADEHTGHRHGVSAAHAHPMQAGRPLVDAPALESGDATDHVVSVAPGWTLALWTLELAAEDWTADLWPPPTAATPLRTRTDVRVHGPPISGRIPPRAPPLAFL